MQWPAKKPRALPPKKSTYLRPLHNVHIARASSTWDPGFLHFRFKSKPLPPRFAPSCRTSYTGITINRVLPDDTFREPVAVTGLPEDSRINFVSWWVEPHPTILTVM